MITTLLATIGLVLHLTAPAAAAAAVRQHARRRQEPRPLSTPQRHYDLVTIGAAVLAVPIVITEAQWFNHPLLIPAWATTGALLPCIFWWASGRSIRRRRRATELATLPAAAISEEVLWRAAAPLLLIYWGLPDIMALALSALGFIALHYRKNNGLSGLAYMAILTAILWGAALLGGILAAIIVHIFHNLVLAAFEPVRPAQISAATPPTSRNTW